MDETLTEDGEIVVSEINNLIEWTPEHEKLLIEWGDKAMC